MALSVIVFDCDGVLLESVAVKTCAFERLGALFGAVAADKLLHYHKSHGGVSRYKKFEWLYREVLGREITPEESVDLGRRFAEIVFDEVCRCPLVPGVEETLDCRYGRTPLYVCSGAPHEELNAGLQARGLARWFTEICGTPPAKAELLRDIVLRAGVAPSEVFMVGDSVTDLRAAEEVGTLFYGLGEELKGGSFPWGEDLTGLNAWLDGLG